MPIISRAEEMQLQTMAHLEEQLMHQFWDSAATPESKEAATTHLHILHNNALPFTQRAHTVCAWLREQDEKADRAARMSQRRFDNLASRRLQFDETMAEMKQQSDMLTIKYAGEPDFHKACKIADEHRALALRRTTMIGEFAEEFRRRVYLPHGEAAL